jgi:hypothetical protein
MNPGSRLSKPMILTLPRSSLIFSLVYILIILLLLVLFFVLVLVSTLSTAIFASFSFPA